MLKLEICRIKALKGFRCNPIWLGLTFHSTQANKDVETPSTYQFIISVHLYMVHGLIELGQDFVSHGAKAFIAVALRIETHKIQMAKMVML